MEIIYFDTSALAKWYLNEENSNEVERYLRVIIERDAAGYYAYCPDLPGCQSQGDSLEEAVARIIDIRIL